MATIDDKVVAMSFENSRFESGVSKSLSTLDRLKQALNFHGAGKGLDQIGASAGKVDLSHIASGIEGIRSKFGALSIAAIAAFSTIVSQAVSAGLRVAKSFTIGPIISGFQEYQTKMGSIQTILANTSAAGTNLKDVNVVLNDLNRYSDQTIYNFQEMTHNIGTFTAAGVDLKTAAGSIKGIANLAALSGSNSQQASVAMYQLSQAISSGRVSLQDWNSVVNAGMGGTIFQRALAQTGVQMGALDKSAVKLSGSMKNVKINGQSFRESIMAAPGKQSWLTGDVLTKTLEQLSGNLTDAELKAQGYSDAQVKAIQTQAKAALAAATQIKTFSQLLDTTKEAIQSGWAETFEILFGNFNEAKTLFTGLGNWIGGIVQKSAGARNQLLKEWKDMGGRTGLFVGIKQAAADISAVIRPIREAFRDLFPKKTATDLLMLTGNFRQLTASLKPSPATINNIRDAFHGLFALLDIGRKIFSGIFTVIKTVFGALAPGTGSLLSFAASVGNLIARLDLWLEKGDRLKNFFTTLGNIIAVPMRLISGLIGVISGLTSGVDDLIGSNADKAFSGMGKALSPVASAANAAKDAWNGFIGAVKGVGSILGPVASAIGSAFKDIGGAIGKALSTGNWDAAFEAIQTALVGGIFLTIKKAIAGGPLIKVDLFKNMSQSMDILRGSLNALQQNIRAKTILEISVAVGVLALAVVALSKVDAKGLARSMTAITISMGQLMAVMAIMQKIGSGGGMMKMPLIASSLIMLAAAIDILSISVITLSKLNWNQLAKGVAGVGALLLELSIAVRPLSKASPGLIIAGAGLIAISASLIVLAGAVRIFATMSWESLGKGLAGVAASLIAIGVAVRAIPPSVLLIGPGLLALSASLAAIAGAVAIFGSMRLGTLAKGIGGLAVALVAIAGAMHLMPLTLPITAAGLVLVAGALVGISASIGVLGKMKVGTLAKGIGAIAAALLVLAGGLTAMMVALPGAAALALAAVGLATLVPVIGMLGKMKIGTIAKGLGAIVVSILAISVAGAVGAPGLLILGAALVVVGAGMATISASIYLLATGISKLAGLSGKSLAVAIAAITAFVALIPKMAIEFAKGLVQVMAALAAVAPQIVASLVKVIDALLLAVIQSAPRMAQAFGALIQAALTVLVQNTPRIVAAGFKILIDLLTGIKNNIVQVTNLAVDIVLRFIATLASRMGQIVAAGLNLLVKFLSGIASGIGRVVTAGADIIVKILQGIANNVSKVVTAGGNIIVKLISGIGSVVSRVVTAGADAIIKFISGVGSKGADIVAAAASAAAKFLNALVKGLLSLIDAGAHAIINFMNGVAGAIRAHSGEMWNAGWNIVTAIIDGMIQGVAQLGQRVLSALGGLISKAIGLAGKLLHIRSPSKVFMDMGQNISMGLALGIEGSALQVFNSMTNMANGLITSIKSIFGVSSPSTVMYNIGRFVGEGFRNGLVSTGDAINKAFTDLNDKLTQAIVNARETIKTEQGKINELRDAKKPDWDAIAKAQAVLRENQNLLNQAVAGQALLTKGLTKQKQELVSLANEYVKVGEQLTAANQVLDDAKKTRDEALASFSTQYGELPKLDTESQDQLGVYLTALANQRDAVAVYTSTLDQLRALGLDEATYRKLLTEGTADQQFASQLLAGGRTAVQGLNVLDAQLASVSKTLATKAASNLYQAGVDAAQGIVNGLLSKQSGITAAMNKIANAMINALKKKLKIKSPSEEFSRLGKMSMEGLAQGFKDSSKLVTDAAETIGANMVTALRTGMKEVSDVLNSEINANPTITPILDLTNARAGSQELNRMLNVVPITAAASYGQASAISLPTPGTGEDIPVPGSTSIKFEQNNYSPESLSPVEIYRQTRNQLSMARSAITKGG